MGRPVDFAQELADEICGQLAEGESLRSICKTDTLPSVGTVMRWLAALPVFREQYRAAREQQAETLADEIIAIADDAQNDYVDTEDGPTPNPEAVQRSKLRVHARQWYASKVLPKKYGERLEIEGGLTHTHMTLDQLAARIAEAEALAGRKVIEIGGAPEKT